jgi:hypothetical protein
VRTATGGNLLTWNFTPDLDNGLPSFRIYRNGWLIKTLQGQTHNFGDAPEQIDIALEFYDQSAANSIYRVTAFNALGESSSPEVQSHANARINLRERQYRFDQTSSIAHGKLYRNSL